MKKLLVFLILFFSLSSNLVKANHETGVVPEFTQPLVRVTDENRVDLELANKEVEDYFRNNLILQSLTNSFIGILNSNGRDRPAVTSFFIDNEGKIAGNYIWYEGYSGMLPIGYSGDLSDCIILNILILQCIWNDDWGDGVFQVKFLENFNSFNGYWSDYNMNYLYNWNGERSEEKRIATEKRITDWLESRKRECSTTIC
jgi:hypothetical protein